MFDRRHFIACATAFAASGAFAQRRTEPLPVVGLMHRASYPEFSQAFVSELARLGQVDGRNVRIERRLAQADLGDVPAQAAELVAMKPAVIVAGSSTWARAVLAIAPSQPLVIVTTAAMVESGYVRSLRRPGGNVTGMDELPPGLTARRLSLLKLAAPQVRKVGLLAASEDAAYRVQLRDALAAARRLRITVKPYPAPSPAAIERALAAMVADGMDGLCNLQSGFSLAHRQYEVEFAARHRLPAIYQATRFVDAGGLMAWSPDQDEQFRAAARTVAKVLRGTRVGDIPVTFPERYHLTVNATAAERIGLAFPRALLAQASRVIR